MYENALRWSWCEGMSNHWICPMSLGKFMKANLLLQNGATLQRLLLQEVKKHSSLCMGMCVRVRVCIFNYFLPTLFSNLSHNMFFFLCNFCLTLELAQISYWSFCYRLWVDHHLAKEYMWELHGDGRIRKCFIIRCWEVESIPSYFTKHVRYRST